MNEDGIGGRRVIGLAGHLLRLWQQLKYATESSGLLSLPARLRIVGVLFDVSGLLSPFRS